MQYMGGKTRIAKSLARVMLDSTIARVGYVEPFVGAGSVAVEMTPHFRHVFLSDASPDLIMMWQALQNGWKPPKIVTEDMYNFYRHAPASAPRGFIGYGCSFGGKWFGGYARDPRKPWSFAQTAINGLSEKIVVLQTAHFYELNYRDMLIPNDAVVYCDPPYRGKTKYERLANFDSDEFWQTAKEWSSYANVFVSEYTAPLGWVSIWNAQPKMTLRVDDNQSTATEHLWVKA